MTDMYQHSPLLLAEDQVFFVWAISYPRKQIGQNHNVVN